MTEKLKNYSRLETTSLNYLYSCPEFLRPRNIRDLRRVESLDYGMIGIFPLKLLAAAPSAERPNHVRAR